ncbi:MAG: winged helix-turn-helix domain-containing protein [Cyanobacteria bacterium P01_F01_bin.150]
MTINIFQRRRAIAEIATQKGHQTLAQIAQALGISQTSVWQHQTARQSTVSTPVSEFWASAAGMGYLIRVVVAVFYYFGITAVFI